MQLSFHPLGALCADDLLPLWGDVAVVRTTGIGTPLTLEECAERLTALRAADDGAVFAVFQNGVFCGLAGCLPASQEPPTYGLFYQLVPSAWGKGIGTAAAKQALSHVQRHRPGARILADVLAENPASERILLRLGFSLLSQSTEPHLGRPAAVRHYALML